MFDEIDNGNRPFTSSTTTLMIPLSLQKFYTLWMT